MSRITTVILLLILLVLAVGVYFGEIKPKSEPQPTVTPSVRNLFDDIGLQPDDITGIRVEDNQNHLSAGIRRVVTQTWELTEPFPGPADSSRAQGLANQAARIIVTNRITQTTDLGAFGLISPTHTITLYTTKGEHTIKVGKKSFNNANYYILRDSDSAVYLVQAFTIDELKKMITTPLIPPTPTVTPTATPFIGPVLPTGTPTATSGPPTATATVTATATP